MADDKLVLSRDHFADMVEAALAGIYVIQDDRLRYVNPALAQMFGYQPEELIDQVNVLDLIHPEDRQGVAERTRQRLAGQLATIPHKARGIRRDGGIIHFEALARPVNYLGKPAVTGTLVNITNCVRAQEKIDRHRRQLKRLSAQLIAAREAENKRISQELHDVIGQALTAVSINLAQIEQDLPAEEPAAIWERLAEANMLIARALDQTRKLSLELRPRMLDDLGLIPTLRWHIHQVEKRLNIPVSFGSLGVPQFLSSGLETVIYRVVQEGLTNIARHAQASNVKVMLDYKADQIHVTISDDGVGFDAQRVMQSEDAGDRFGLLGMAERISLYSGMLQVHSSPGQGTTLEVTFPYSKPVEN